MWQRVREDLGLILLFWGMIFLAFMAFRELGPDEASAEPAAEVERCRDWCRLQGWTCACGSDIG